MRSVALNMVVYNESHRIYESLRQCSDVVDLMIIIDQSSTDNTRSEIDRFAADWGKDVYCYTDKHWGYCEPSRVRAWENSGGADWILVLDADERVSDEFVAEMRYLDVRGFKGARLQRSFWLGGQHRFTGDFQYRMFDRTCVKFLDAIHTEPQPYGLTEDKIYSTPYIGIWHEKSWAEQERDELAYAELIPKLESHPEIQKRKLELNVHLPIIEQSGLTAQEIDLLTLEERRIRGL